MTKRVLALLASSLLVLALAGCNSTDTTEEPAVSDELAGEEVVVEETTEEVVEEEPMEEEMAEEEAAEEMTEEEATEETTEEAAE